MPMRPDRHVIIAGAGTVGLTLGLAIRNAEPDLRVTLVDGRPPDEVAPDLRASAISAAARRMLERLGVWELVAEEAQPIHEMVIGDTRTADVGRPVFLTFAGTAAEGEPFAHMVPNQALASALQQRASEARLQIQAPARVTDFLVGSDHIGVRIAAGREAGEETLDAALLVAADGGRSKLRDLAGIPTVGWSYAQSGIVVTVEHERPHEGKAREDFLPAGPFAVLPLKGNRSSLVWTERTETAARLVKADPLTFRAELELRFGHELGHIKPVGPTEAYPLEFRLARRFIGPRLALCGDAAHAIHPIAGQGLNLGLKDVAALAEAVVEGARLGLDIGSEEVLRRYEAWRRYDTIQMGLMTDGLNRLFSNDNSVLRLARDVGLGLVDRLPFLKRAFIRQAAGEAGELPRLLRGEAI